jgi:hypothetical protein
MSVQPAESRIRVSGSTAQHSNDTIAKHVADFKGVLHADGYARFNAIFEKDTVAEAACWAYVRRKFFDEYESHKAPVAKEMLDRIGALYGIEAETRGKPPDKRKNAAGTIETLSRRSFRLAFLN